MYDISGWSHRLLWGAAVDISRNAAPRVATSPVRQAASTGSVDAPRGKDLALSLRDGNDVRAVNELLRLGVKLRADARTVVVPAEARPEAASVAHRFGVRFTAAPRGAQGEVFDQPVIAAAVSADELFALNEMGFQVRTVSTAVLNAGADLSDVDTLLVSSGLSYTALNATGRAAVDAYLARGGGVVTRGATGAAFNAAAGLLPATAVAARGDANGVVNVDNVGPVVGAGSLPHSFVYSPLWFTGSGFTVEQRYGADPLVAGHWLPTAAGTNGQAQAAGQAAVVSGTTARGGKTVLFGTEPLFRAHPKGLYAQYARALFWTAGGLGI
jgi:hypothetical protein